MPYAHNRNIDVDVSCDITYAALNHNRRFNQPTSRSLSIRLPLPCLPGCTEGNKQYSIGCTKHGLKNAPQSWGRVQKRSAAHHNIAFLAWLDMNRTPGDELEKRCNPKPCKLRTACMSAAHALQSARCMSSPAHSRSRTIHTSVKKQAACDARVADVCRCWPKVVTANGSRSMPRTLICVSCPASEPHHGKPGCAIDVSDRASGRLEKPTAQTCSATTCPDETKTGRFRSILDCTSTNNS